MMPRRFRVVVFALSAWLCGAAAGADEFAFFHENVMGTSLELRVRADREEDARRAETRALAEIDRLSAIFSGYDPASEFRRWQAQPGGPVALSPELFEVFQASDFWRERSGGAFDPRVEALTRLWSACARKDRAPDDTERAAARALMAHDAWRLDSQARTAERLSECPLSFNAIAKGYIVEKACAAALDARRGVRGLLLNVGGDLRVGGDFEGTIGIAPPGGSEASEPFTRFEVRDRSVSTSGATHRGWRIGGRWYSHIFDPNTGAPAEHVVNATVIAPRGADADALATALNVLPIEEGLRLAASVPGVECLLVAADGRVARSAGWHRHERPGPFALTGAPPEAPAGAWGGEYELAVDFEINRPGETSGRYRRPYVVVWVEDKNGVALRTLVLWVSLGGQGPDRWLPDLKRWYRDDKRGGLTAKKNMVYTIAQPTRNAGKYTAVWDGKDDQGRSVAQGEYTISIEAAREHGTYQIIRKTVTLADRPFAEELKGNVEIKSAAIQYRRKGKK